MGRISCVGRFFFRNVAPLRFLYLGFFFFLSRRLALGVSETERNETENRATRGEEKKQIK